MTTVYSDQDYKWTSKSLGMVLKPYTSLEMQELKTRFILENNPQQDGSVAYLNGNLYIWAHTRQDWVLQRTAIPDPVIHRHEFLNQNTINIAHNMKKYPSVTVKDTAGSLWIPKNIDYISIDNITIQFDTVFSGIVYLS